MTDLSSSLPGIDVATGLARVAGNKKLYLKLLRHVAGDADNTLEKISQAIAANDAQTVSEVAHSLKGASANLSITEVAAAAEYLEHSAKTGDIASLPGHLEALAHALTSFVEVVDTLQD